jgi:arginine exporter protein ArgO
MRNSQARFVFRVLAAPVAALTWFGAVAVGFHAVASGDFKQLVGALVGCLLASLFTLVAFRGEAPRWLYAMFTWGERP